MTSGERMVFAASMAASSDARRDSTLAVKAAAMAVQFMRRARDEDRQAQTDGVVNKVALTEDERAMLEDMLSNGGDR